jgi:hypothetical protein
MRFAASMLTATPTLRLTALAWSRRRHIDQRRAAAMARKALAEPASRD